MVFELLKTNSLVAKKVVVNRSSGLFYFVGLTFLSNAVFVRLLSSKFLYELDLSQAPVHWYLISQLCAGLLLLLLVLLNAKTTPSRLKIIFIVGSGLAMRLLMFGTDPVLEVDFYRYLWDGAVTANGFNPYSIPPSKILSQENLALQSLVVDSGPVHERVNYPYLTTIYPPVAQVFFALSYWIGAWDIDIWRLILLGSDLVTMALIMALLIELKRSLVWVSVYWWNPLVVTEIFNSVHMDALLLPFLLFAILLLMKKRQVLASGFLVVAAGVKIWPLMLLPFCLRSLVVKPAVLLYSLGGILTAMLLIFFPYILIESPVDSGLIVFSQEWQRGSGLFDLLRSILIFLFGERSAEILSRIFIVILIGGFIFYLNRRIIPSADEMISAITWSIFLLVLLNPIQLPWYGIWFAPLICFYSRSVMLVFLGLAPLYYFQWTIFAGTLIHDFASWTQHFVVTVMLLGGLVSWLNRCKTNGDHGSESEHLNVR